MNVLRQSILPLILTFTSGCSSPVTEPVSVAESTPQPTPPVSTPDAVTARVEALIADTKRKEAEYQESQRVAIEKSAAAALNVPVYTEVTPPRPTVAQSNALGSTNPSGSQSVTDTKSEAYWRERRRAYDVMFREHQAASKAAFDLFILMDKTGIARTNPAEYVKAMSEMKRSSEVVADDVKRGLPALYAEAERAGVPRAWVDPREP